MNMPCAMIESLDSSAGDEEPLVDAWVDSGWKKVVLGRWKLRELARVESELGVLNSQVLPRTVSN
jgi:hypothetical protein